MKIIEANRNIIKVLHLELSSEKAKIHSIKSINNKEIVHTKEEIL